MIVKTNGKLSKVQSIQFFKAICLIDRMSSTANVISNLHRFERKSVSINGLFYMNALHCFIKLTYSTLHVRSPMNSVITLQQHQAVMLRHLHSDVLFKVMLMFTTKR